MTTDEMIGGHRFIVRSRFRNLFPVEIDNKTVRDANFVRRAVIQGNADQER